MYACVCALVRVCARMHVCAYTIYSVCYHNLHTLVIMTHTNYCPNKTHGCTPNGTNTGVLGACMCTDTKSATVHNAPAYQIEDVSLIPFQNSTSSHSNI